MTCDAGNEGVRIRIGMLERDPYPAPHPVATRTGDREVCQNAFVLFAKCT